MKNNYLPTSNLSGLVQAPRAERYFIQKLSRQGKSAGQWVYLKNGQGQESKQIAESILKLFEYENPDHKFRLHLASVFV